MTQAHQLLLDLGVVGDLGFSEPVSSSVKWR